jgi:hypothetical protein
MFKHACSRLHCEELQRNVYCDYLNSLEELQRCSLRCRQQLVTSYSYTLCFVLLRYVYCYSVCVCTIELATRDTHRTINCVAGEMWCGWTTLLTQVRYYASTYCHKLHTIHIYRCKPSDCYTVQGCLHRLAHWLALHNSIACYWSDNMTWCGSATFTMCATLAQGIGHDCCL